MLDELNAWMTATTAYVTKDMHIWQEASCRWDECRGGAHCEVLRM